MIAKWVKFQVLDTERQDWARGYDAARRYFEREGSLDVPYEHAEGTYPLGRWLSDQRRAYRAGTMSSTRADELDELGMIWDTADTQFAENLAAARAYYAEAGTLAAPRHATALDKPVGQWLTNLHAARRTGEGPRTRSAACRATRRDRPGLEPRTVGVDRRLATPLGRAHHPPHGRMECWKKSRPASPTEATTSDAGPPGKPATGHASTPNSNTA